MLFSSFERLMAWRYLRARRQEGFISVITWFSLLGIGLGVATLIIVMSVMNGFREELFSRGLGLNGHLNVYATDGLLYDYEPLAEKVRGINEVVEVSPSVEGQVLITKNGSASGAFVRGVVPSVFSKRPTISSHIVEGNMASFQDDTIIIGIRMARRLSVHVGDALTLISPVGSSTIFGSAPRMRAYTVAAIFDVGMFEYDNNFIFMPLPAAQTFFRDGEGVSTLEVFVKNPHDFMNVKFRMVDALVGSNTRLLDWQQNNSSFFTALQVERNVMFLILTLIIVVAAFNIISSLIMLVKDKGHDIAILRTMGATRGMVMRIFLLCGASVGVVGTFFGCLLGVLIASNIETVREIIQRMTGTELFSAEVYFLTHLPSKMDWREVAQVVGMSVGLSFLATLYPSWRAAKLDPVEALRYE